MDESQRSDEGRRRFLKSVGALGAAIPAAAAAQHAGHVAVKAEKYMFLAPAEVAFLDAAVARLIPADDLGPGAKEAGVTYFIDQQLFGGWGAMAKMYRQGPHTEGTPQQGYQSPLTPQEVYRAAIAEVNAACAKQYGKSFDKLATAQQDEVLHALDEGRFPLDAVPPRFFFNILLDNTVEGFFRIRSTAATATRLAGSSSASPALPPRIRPMSRSTACLTTRCPCRSRTSCRARARSTSMAIPSMCCS